MSGVQSQGPAHPAGLSEEGCSILLRVQSRASPATIPLILMRPSNDRELAIARTIDTISIKGGLDLTQIDEAVAALGFPVMHNSDNAYLVLYIQWRMENPIVRVEDPLKVQR